MTMKLKSWSFSRYSDYKQCPLKAKLKHIDRIKEPPNDAMARGANIHKIAERYIKGETPAAAPFPEELGQFKEEFEMLRQRYKKRLSAIVVEDDWAFTKDWDQTKWDDWANCWVRIKLDCAHELAGDILVITDWKTGKYRPEQEADYLEQLQLYALAALLLKPHLKEVHPRLVYLDQGLIHPDPSEPIIYDRSDLPKLKKIWEKRVQPMLNDTAFPPKPNQFCKWCHFRASNKAAGGGQCKF